MFFTFSFADSNVLSVSHIFVFNRLISLKDFGINNYSSEFLQNEAVVFGRIQYHLLKLVCSSKTFAVSLNVVSIPSFILLMRSVTFNSSIFPISVQKLSNIALVCSVPLFFRKNFQLWTSETIPKLQLLLLNKLWLKMEEKTGRIWRIPKYQKTLYLENLIFLFSVPWGNGASEVLRTRILFLRFSIK